MGDRQGGTVPGWWGLEEEEGGRGKMPAQVQVGHAAGVPVAAPYLSSRTLVVEFEWALPWVAEEGRDDCNARPEVAAHVLSLHVRHSFSTRAYRTGSSGEV